MSGTSPDRTATESMTRAAPSGTAARCHGSEKRQHRAPRLQHLPRHRPILFKRRTARLPRSKDSRHAAAISGRQRRTTVAHWVLRAVRARVTRVAASAPARVDELRRFHHAAMPIGVGIETRNGTSTRVPAIGASQTSMSRWAARYLIAARLGHIAGDRHEIDRADHHRALIAFLGPHHVHPLEVDLADRSACGRRRSTAVEARRPPGRSDRAVPATRISDPVIGSITPLRCASVTGNRSGSAPARARWWIP